MPKVPQAEVSVDVEDVSIDLYEVASTLGEVYFIRKDAEDEQKALREEFFEAVTASHEDQDLARKTVPIPEDIFAAESTPAYAERYFPGWRVVEVDEDGKRLMLEEDPAYKQHAQVISLDPWEVLAPTKARPDKTKKVYGYVITKTIRNGSPGVDNERLAEVDKELYHRVTEYRYSSDLLELASELGESEEFIINWLASRDWPLTLRSDLTPEELEELRPYTFESAKTVALNVRYATEDEGDAE